MKRFVPSLIVLVLAAASLVAVPAHAGMALGVKGGLCVSRVNADLYDGTKSLNGAVGGVYGSFDFSPMFGVQPEVLYVRKGANLFKTQVDFLGLTYLDVGENLELDYVEIPLLLRYSVPAGEVMDLRLLAGPVASFKVAEQFHTVGVIDYALHTDQMKTTDFGIAAGSAVAFGTGVVRVVGEVRYTLGLTDISDLPLGLGGKIRNGAFYGMIGLELPLGAP